MYRNRVDFSPTKGGLKGLTAPNCHDTGGLGIQCFDIVHSQRLRESASFTDWG